MIYVVISDVPGGGGDGDGGDDLPIAN